MSSDQESRAAALAALRATVQVERPCVAVPHPPVPLRDPDDLLARVASDGQLMAAWVAVREADMSDGRASRSVRWFERDALNQLARLQALLYDGSWNPSPVSHVTAPDDPTRIFTISGVEDRIVERALSDVLGPRLDSGLSPYSFAYRRGVGVRDAVAALRESILSGATHVARADVAHAFDSVPRRQVLAALGERVVDKRVVRLVELLLTRLDTAGMDGRGIAQGSSVSPLLLNVYLDPLDRHLMDEGFVPIRYSDDMAIPADSESGALEVLGMVAQFLEPLGLGLNSHKTGVEVFASGVTFLGQRVGPLGTPDPADTHVHPRRMTLYVMGHGCLVRLAKGHARVTREGQTTASVSLNRVRQIVLGAHSHITTPLLREASRHGIDVVLLDGAGQFEGRLSRRRGGDVRVRQAQFRAADDPEVALGIARQFVAAKIGNLRVLILRDLRRTAGDTQGPRTRVARELEGWAEHARQAITTESLMGVEGIAARAYFEWVRHSLAPEWGFVGRNRRPPRDPVNAMLSYCYTLLSGEMISAAEIAGLDPDLGFLHSPRWGRPSLALDLLEPWRPVLADATVFALVRSGSISPDDFLIDAERGARMSDKARKALLAAYERRMLTPAGSAQARGRKPYRELLADFARVLADHLVDPETEFRSYQWR